MKSCRGTEEKLTLHCANSAYRGLRELPTESLCSTDPLHGMTKVIIYIRQAM